MRAFSGFCTVGLFGALLIATVPAFAAGAQYYGQASSYGPAAVGSMMNNAGGVNAPQVSPTLGAAVNGMNVQTNIDNSKSIDGSSNINVNETINGANIAYGQNGASVLGYIDNASAYAAGAFAGETQQRQQAVHSALLDEELQVQFGNGN